MTSPLQLSANEQPSDTATVDQWIDWFTDQFLPAWVKQARIPDSKGFYDQLDINAKPTQCHRSTLLAQARLLFTFSHLAHHSSNPVFKDAAKVAREALPLFRDTHGGYCRAISTSTSVSDARDTSHDDGHIDHLSGEHGDERVFSYDQSFVILGLATWEHLLPDVDETLEIESCWSALETRLTDPKTGLLLEHNEVRDASIADTPPRAQNPHMHLYEAALQAFEMTRKPIWLDRAKQMRIKGLEYFYDANSGSIIEFIAPDLGALPGRDGTRREVGHQCEWAWLLRREATLSGQSDTKEYADALLSFSDNIGFSSTGIMQGGAFDAVSSDAQWREESFLLWPQTEAIKTHAIRSASPEHARKAEALMLLVFKQYFAGKTAFINQVDSSGTPLWSEALSRLLYHLVLAITEGARSGLWRLR